MAAMKVQGGKMVPANKSKDYSQKLDLVWSDLVALSTQLNRISAANKDAIATVPGASKAIEDALTAIRNASRVIRQF